MITVEVRTPDGQKRFYEAGSTERLARREARKMIARMAHICQDNRILWKLSCDRDWSMGAYRPESSSRKLFRKVDEVKEKSVRMANRVVDYFFDETTA